jgi:hypothetical protein
MGAAWIIYQTDLASVRLAGAVAVRVQEVLDLFKFGLDFGGGEVAVEQVVDDAGEKGLARAVLEVQQARDGKLDELEQGVLAGRAVRDLFGDREEPVARVEQLPELLDASFKAARSDGLAPKGLDVAVDEGGKSRARSCTGEEIYR